VVSLLAVTKVEAIQFALVWTKQLRGEEEQWIIRTLGCVGKWRW
jgi:hypothetical protein